MAIPEYNSSLSLLENGEDIYRYLFNEGGSLLDLDQDQGDAYAAFILDLGMKDDYEAYLSSTFGDSSTEMTEWETFWEARGYVAPTEEESTGEPEPSDGEEYWDSQEQYEDDPSTEEDGVWFIDPTREPSADLVLVETEINNLKTSIQRNVKKDLTKLMSLRGVVAATGVDCCISDNLSGAYNYLCKVCQLDLSKCPNDFVSALIGVKSLWDEARTTLDGILDFFQTSAIIQGAREMINGAESLISDVSASFSEALEKITELERAVVSELTDLAESVLAPLSGFIACIPAIEGMPDFPGAGDLAKLNREINNEVAKRLNGEIANRITGDASFNSLTQKIDELDAILIEDGGDQGSLKNKAQAKAVGVFASTVTGDAAKSALDVLSTYAIEDLTDWDTIKNTLQSYTSVADQDTFNTIVDTYLC